MVDAVRTTTDGPVRIVHLDRPAVRNAVDEATASALDAAFMAFDADPEVSVAVLTGEGGHFCAGADLKATAQGQGNAVLEPSNPRGPMGPTRRSLTKPVIAAIEGYAVAGGLELALWCDLRVAARSARFGVFCRRWGVPLIDGGTIRLPRLIGQSRAMDLILTGREVDAEEALHLGLINRVVNDGTALAAAVDLAHQLASFPQRCLRGDRASVLEQWGLDLPAALGVEYRHGWATITSGETAQGAQRFSAGAGRHGEGVDR